MRAVLASVLLLACNPEQPTDTDATDSDGDGYPSDGDCDDGDASTWYRDDDGDGEVDYEVVVPEDCLLG